MASTRTKTWTQPTPPSSAFLIKCAKEKEKLRSKFRKQLQEHMLYMLNEAVHTNINLGINVGKGSFGEAKLLSQKPESGAAAIFKAHKSVLKVRTPAFLDHIKKYEELDIFTDVSSCQTYLEEVELKEFMKKVYTDDDIRRYECEALRISKTHIDILCEKKSLLNKHIIDTDEFDKEESVHSTGTDNFITPKTSPLTPEGLLDLPDILQMKQKSYRIEKSEASDKMRKNSQTVPDNKETDLLNDKHEISDEYVNEFDATQNDESMVRLDFKFPRSAIAFNSAEISNTSVDIDESVLDELCSPTAGVDGSEESDVSGSSPSATGMVRSNTFDLHTQAPLEDFIDKLEENNNAPLAPCHKLESFHGLEDSIELESSVNVKSENSGFYLHDKTSSPKPNLFNLIENQTPMNNIINNNNNVHLRRNDGSMSDSGFMSYSTFSTVSETALSSSLMMSDSNASALTKSCEESITNLDKTKRLSGSMFPFYIDINNLPPDRSALVDDKKSLSSSVYMFIDASKPKEFLRSSDVTLRDRKDRRNANFANPMLGKSKNVNDINLGNLTKAVSSPHLHSSRDFSSPLPCNENSSRPQSCYMYIDLDSIEEKSNLYPKVKRAPSSISMYVDLSDDSIIPLTNSNKSQNNENESQNYNYVNSDEPSKVTCSKSLVSNNQEIETITISDSKHVLLDTYLVSSDSDSPKIKFHSLRKPTENSSDSELNNLILRKHNKLQSNANTDLFSTRSSSDIPSSLNRVFNSYDIQKQFSTFLDLQHPKNTSISSSDSCQPQLKDKQSEINFLNALYNDLIMSQDKPKSNESQSKKNIEIDKETGLLPMSPILRRKTPNKDQPKPVPPVVVKASTLPQDLDAMKFPVPEKDESMKLVVSKSAFPISSSIQTSSDSLHQKSSHGDDSKSSNDSSKIDGESSHVANLTYDKLHENISRSESSVVVSGGETSSSEKIIASDASKDHVKSPLSSYFPYEFEDDVETIYSEVSDLSSSLGGLSGVASLERRWREGYSLVKDVSAHGIHNMYRMLEACSKLGEDMLRMFLEEIDTDIVIEVGGSTIKAHRCILVSRCKYFANLLKGDNFANGESINLEGFSFLSVHFALCHIYSGAINLPKDINIIELGLLADVLSLDTLVDVIILHLKTHYCHFFHKPCQQCTQGVIECLPLAVTCGFTNLQEKCIHWLGKYFTKTWTNKPFAALSEELRNLCFQSTVKDLTVETAIEMTLSCDRIINTLPHLKWTEPVFGMVSNLLQECIHFMANNFNKVLCSEGFLVLGKGQSWNVSALDDDIMSSVELMTPDVACKSCVKIYQILSLAESGGCPEYGEFTQNFIELLHKISRGIERYLIHNANKVVHCQSWACLPSEVQKKVKDAAVIVFEFEKPTAKPPRLSSLQKKWKKQKDGDSYGYFENLTYPKPFRCAKGYSSEFSDKTFCVQRKSDKDKKNDHQKDVDHHGKKIVSPIKEESQAHGTDSKRSVDCHEEDSLREMQDLPHDQSITTSHGIFLDISQNSSSVGNMESEDNHSGTHCSDNPDSLDANEDISMDSRDELENSIFVDDDIEKEKSNRINNAAVTEIIGHLHSKVDNFTNIPAVQNPSAFSNSKIATQSSDSKLVSPRTESKVGRNYDTSPTKKSPVKSFVPLSTTHILHDKDLLSQGKDLVAEIDADSRMVTHCLQEAEMLEQQLSRKLHQQKTVSSKTSYSRCNNNNVIPCSDIRRSSRISVSRVQKSLSTSQMKNLVPAAVRGKSPGKMTQSPSSPQVPRLARASEVARENKPSSRKPLQTPRISLVTTQKAFHSVDGISVSNAQKPLVPTKRISTRSIRTRTSVVTSVRESRGASVGPNK